MIVKLVKEFNSCVKNTSHSCCDYIHGVSLFLFSERITFILEGARMDSELCVCMRACKSTYSEINIVREGFV